MQHRLYELRRARNITQQRLAIDLGVDQASISSYECGKHLPTIEILLKLAEYFGVSTDYLLGLSDIKTPIKFVADDQSAYLLSLFESLSGNYRERVIGYVEALKDIK